MVEIIWTGAALDDLDKIAEYIAISNPTAAKKLIQLIFEKVERLELNPESGKKPLEIKNLNYREILVNPCRIFYKYEGESVFILHVLRQERDLRRYLLSQL
ncbi:MAG: type II toxin-antitoxin system RelE/ParE family toxin [Aestuariibacter sp.]